MGYELSGDRSDDVNYLFLRGQDVSIKRIFEWCIIAFLAWYLLWPESDFDKVSRLLHEIYYIGRDRRMRRYWEEPTWKKGDSTNWPEQDAAAAKIVALGERAIPALIARVGAMYGQERGNPEAAELLKRLGEPAHRRLVEALKTGWISHDSMPEPRVAFFRGDEDPQAGRARVLQNYAAVLITQFSDWRFVDDWLRLRPSSPESNVSESPIRYFISKQNVGAPPFATKDFLDWWEIEGRSRMVKQPQKKSP